MTMPPTASLESISMSVSSPITPVILNQPPLETYPELFIATAQTPPGGEAKNRVFNYYFLFLALLAAILAALLWWLHRQRRREQEQIRLRGQRALVRDVERWAMYRRRQPPTVEGLNESGEAPPPYKSKDDILTALELVRNTMDLAVDVAIPPRALSRDEIEHVQLPDYSETIQVHKSNVGTQSARSLNNTVSTRAGPA